jgi:hypothetical protein
MNFSRCAFSLTPLPASLPFKNQRNDHFSYFSVWRKVREIEKKKDKKSFKWKPNDKTPFFANSVQQKHQKKTTNQKLPKCAVEAHTCLFQVARLGGKLVTCMTGALPKTFATVEKTAK